jgi:hypothetical protein
VSARHATRSADYYRCFSALLPRGYVAENPVANGAGQERETEVEILSVIAARLLESASSDMLPFRAIGAFAGLVPPH